MNVVNIPSTLTMCLLPVTFDLITSQKQVTECMYD